MSDLKLWKAIWEIRYPAAALLFDNRGKIATEWQHHNQNKDLTEWRISNNQVTIHNKTWTKMLAATYQSLVVEMEMLQHYDVFIPLAKEFTLNVLDTLNVSQLDRVGLRLLFVAPRTGNFKSLVHKVRENIYTLEKKHWNTIGGYPKDIGLPLTLEIGDRKAKFRFGPMTKKEATEERNYYRSNEAKEGLPSIFLFMDFDLFQVKPNFKQNMFNKKLADMLDTSGPEIESMANNFIEAFGGFK